VAVDEPAAAAAGIKHYGVKGMHWGVTRAKVAAGATKGAKAVYDTYKPSKDAIDSQKYQTRAKIGGVRNLNNAEMRKVITRMQLEQQYRDLYGERQYHDEGVSQAKRWAKKGARWAGRFTEGVAKDAATSWVARPGGRPPSNDPVKVRSWTTGQNFAVELDSVHRKALGS
jgi:hypothetical protein